MTEHFKPHSAVQADATAVQTQIRNARTLIAAAEDRRSALQSTRVVLSTRIADATAVLVATRSLAKRAALRDAHASQSGDTVSLTRLPDPRHAYATSPCSTASSPVQQPHPSSITGGLLRRPRLHDRLDCAPAPLNSFSYSAAIAYADLRNMAGDGDRLIDFSQHSTAQLVDQVCISRAHAVGCAAGPAAVSWFVQLDHEVAPGRHLSLSASLSSPECLASLMLQSALMRLHLALLTAGLDDPGKHLSCPHL